MLTTIFDPSTVRRLHNASFGAGVFGRPGPSDEDIAYEQGYTATLAAGIAVDPPAGLDDVEWGAFCLGVDDGLDELISRLRGF